MTNRNHALRVEAAEVLANLNQLHAQLVYLQLLLRVGVRNPQVDVIEL
jgi:hypothetical protein